MADMPIPEFAEAMSRIQHVTGCRTQSELAKFLGSRQSSIADAKKRGAILVEWLVKLLRLRAINADWILTGDGARQLKPSSCDYPETVTPSPVYIKEIRPPQECSTEDLVVEIV